MRSTRPTNPCGLRVAMAGVWLMGSCAHVGNQYTTSTASNQEGAGRSAAAAPYPDDTGVRYGDNSCLWELAEQACLSSSCALRQTPHATGVGAASREDDPRRTETSSDSSATGPE
jgi:hypothetical protein